MHLWLCPGLEHGARRAGTELHSASCAHSSWHPCSSGGPSRAPAFCPHSWVMGTTKTLPFLGKTESASIFLRANGKAYSEEDRATHTSHVPWSCPTWRTSLHGCPSPSQATKLKQGPWQKHTQSRREKSLVPEWHPLTHIFIPLRRPPICQMFLLFQFIVFLYP